MNCRDFHGGYRDWAEQRLSAEAARELQEHTEECAACAELLRRSRELSCRELIEFLDDYIEERLPVERRAVFDRHLEVCDECVDYLESYRRTAALGPAMARVEAAVPPEVPADLIRAILETNERIPGTEDRPRAD